MGFWILILGWIFLFFSLLKKLSTVALIVGDHFSLVIFSKMKDANCWEFEVARWCGLLIWLISQMAHNTSTKRVGTRPLCITGSSLLTLVFVSVSWTLFMTSSLLPNSGYEIMDVGFCSKSTPHFWNISFTPSLYYVQRSTGIGFDGMKLRIKPFETG